MARQDEDSEDSGVLIKDEDDDKSNVLLQASRPNLPRKAKSHAKVKILVQHTDEREGELEGLSSEDERRAQKRIILRERMQGESSDSDYGWQGILKKRPRPLAASDGESDGSGIGRQRKVRKRLDPRARSETQARSSEFGHEPLVAEVEELELSAPQHGDEDHPTVQKDNASAPKNVPKKVRKTYVCEKPNCPLHIQQEAMTLAELKRHMVSNHLSESIVCNIDNCNNRAFLTLDAFEKHRSSKHSDETWFCGLSDNQVLQCRAMFSSEAALNQHKDRQHAERLHFCDVKDCYFAGLKIPLTKIQLQTHKDGQHANQRQWKPTQELCTQSGCGQILSSKSALRRHEWLHHGLNGRPNASRAIHISIASKELPEQELIPDDDPFVEHDASLECDPPLEDDLSVEDRIDLDLGACGSSRTSLLLPSWNEVFTVNPETLDAQDESSHWVKFLRGLFLELIDEKHPKLDSTRWERNIHLIRQYPNYRIRIWPLLNRHCIGPNLISTQKFIREACGANHHLSLSTARLKISCYRHDDGFEDVLELNRRCFTCEHESIVNYFLKKWKLFQTQPNPLDQRCDAKGCQSTVAFRHSSMCQYHILVWETRQRVKKSSSLAWKNPKTKTLFGLLQSTEVTLGKTWLDLKEFMRARNDSSLGHRSHKFCFVDTEFTSLDPNTRTLQEVTFLDVQGNVLLDVCIKGSDDKRHNPMLLPRMSGQASNRSLLPLPSQETIGLRSLAERMGNLGLGPHTTFIQWGTSGIDSQVISRGFESMHLSDVIDPKKVLLPLYEWRKCLRGCPTFAMDVFFPLVFPKSELVGMNHRSLPDARMLFNLTDLLCSLSDPPGVRDVSRFEDLGFAPGRTEDLEELTEDCQDADTESDGSMDPEAKIPADRFLPTHHQRCWLVESLQKREKFESAIERFERVWGFRISKRQFRSASLKAQMKITANELEAWKAGGRSKDLLANDRVSATDDDIVAFLRTLEAKTSLRDIHRKFMDAHPGKTIGTPRLALTIKRVESGELPWPDADLNTSKVKQFLLRQVHSWTDEQDQRMLELVKQGKSRKEISSTVNTEFRVNSNKFTVENRLRKLQGPINGRRTGVRWTKEAQDYLIEQFQAGYGDNTIAKHINEKFGLDCDYKSVSNRRHKLGCRKRTSRNRKWTAAEESKLMELWKPRMPLAKLAEAMSAAFPSTPAFSGHQTKERAAILRKASKGKAPKGKTGKGRAPKRNASKRQQPDTFSESEEAVDDQSSDGSDEELEAEESSEDGQQSDGSGKEQALDGYEDDDEDEEQQGPVASGDEADVSNDED